MTQDMTTDFEQALERHRRELHVHCYRMLGSFDEAEDALQEAFLRAWRAHDAHAGEINLRAWLYKIATNVCLDAMRKSKRQVPTLESKADIPWLQPYPDRLLDEVAPAEQEPDAVVVARETIELTFIALIQLLPARQRAVVILRDVLDWSAAETAELLDISVASANSALQRARETLRNELPERPSERPVSSDVLSEEEQRLLAGFIAAHEAGDARGVGRADARGHPRHDAAAADGLRRPRRDRAAARARLRRRRDGRLAARPDAREPDARRRQLPAQAAARPSGARSSSTSCAARTAASPRSRPSTRRCSSSSACRGARRAMSRALESL